jgi:hypothetical protein
MRGKGRGRIMALWLWGGLLIVALAAAYITNYWHNISKPIVLLIKSTVLRSKRHSVRIIALAALAWTLFVVTSGTGVKFTNINWDFSNTAALGDSFGVLSSGMAGIAAYFAFRTYKAASDEARLAERRAAEPSFLNLLRTRFVMIENITRQSGQVIADGARSNVLRGQLALNWAASELWHRLAKVDDYNARKRIYDEFIAESIGGLTNYHRFTYHIIAFAQRQFSELEESEAMSKDDPSYGYIQLLRAQISDEELQLIAFNSLYGRGYPKLKLLIERFALFNNMPDVDIETFCLPDEFKLTAFGLLKEDRPVSVTDWHEHRDGF